MRKIAWIIAVLFCFELRAEYELIGGQPDLSGLYKEVVYVNNFFSACSATVVGERVLLIAAHCVGDNTWVQAFSGAFQAQCHYAPEGFDFALCLIDRPVEGPYGKIGSLQPKVGQLVTLTGYGCIKRGGGGGNDKVLRYGKAAVLNYDSEENGFVTKGDVALCSGDSGGPAFMEVNGARELIGVNSKGDLKQYSILVGLYFPIARRFFFSFVEEYKVDICGINKTC